MNRFDALTRVLSDMPIFYTQRSPSLELLRERGFTAPRDTSLCESMFGRMVVSRQLLFNKEKIHKRAVCLLGTCVTWFPMPYPKITYICPCLPDTKFARVTRLHDSIEMNAKYQVIVSSYGVMGFQVRSCIYRSAVRRRCTCSIEGNIR